MVVIRQVENTNCGYHHKKKIHTLIIVMQMENAKTVGTVEKARINYEYFAHVKNTNCGHYWTGKNTHTTDK